MRAAIALLACALSGCMMDVDVHAGVSNHRDDAVTATVVIEWVGEGPGVAFNATRAFAPGYTGLTSFERPCQQDRVGSVFYHAWTPLGNATYEQPWDTSGCNAQSVYLSIGDGVRWEETWD